MPFRRPFCTAEIFDAYRQGCYDVLEHYMGRPYFQCHYQRLAHNNLIVGEM